MKVFLDRNCEEFHSFITEKMSVKSLLETAIEIKEPEAVNGITYTKCIRIDIMGMCASLYFDRSHEVTQFDLYSTLETLIQQSEMLNKKGIFIKIRVLLLYPFCISALTRMNAEISSNRSSITEPAYTRSFSILDEFTERTFWGASFNITQQTVISQIQELRELISKTDSWKNSKNQFTVQYTPTHININYIQINNLVFVEPYVYAKNQRFNRRCSVATPITIIDDESKRKVFEDNFRYLWLNDVTIEEDDAMEVVNGKLQILPPQSIKYTHKSKSIKKTLTATSTERSENNINRLERRWVSYVTHQLKNRFCDVNLFQNTPDNIFITCSWITDENDVSAPHEVAIEIQRVFSKCIKKDTRILEAVTGDSLTRQLYDSLNAAESAIILLTKDIKVKRNIYYSRPNVYIELGYLMKHLGKKHVLIIAEDGVQIPSDVQDITRLNFKNIYKVFPKILNWLEDINVLNTHLKEEANIEFCKYLEQKLINNTLSQKDFNCIKKLIFPINNLKT